jgi:hypothetical protein
MALAGAVPLRWREKLEEDQQKLGRGELQLELMA